MSNNHNDFFLFETDQQLLSVNCTEIGIVSKPLPDSITVKVTVMESLTIAATVPPPPDPNIHPSSSNCLSLEGLFNPSQS